MDLEIISSLSPIAGYVCVQCAHPLLLAASVCLAEHSRSLNSNFLGLISYIGIVVYSSSLSKKKKKKLSNNGFQALYDLAEFPFCFRYV